VHAVALRKSVDSYVSGFLLVSVAIRWAGRVEQQQ